MSGSVEVVLWIHEYEHKALERQLALDGSSIEKTMQFSSRDQIAPDHLTLAFVLGRLSQDAWPV